MALLQDIGQIILLSVASLLLLVGIVTDSWIVYRNGYTRAGLFVKCFGDMCYEYEGNHAVKTMVVLGLLTAVFCSVCMILHLILKFDFLPQVVLFTSGSGAFLVILGCIIYGFNHFTSNDLPGIAFYLTVIGAFILLIGGAASSKKK